MLLGAQQSLCQASHARNKYTVLQHFSAYSAGSVISLRSKKRCHPATELKRFP
jgi:hypothetical protein